MAIISGSYWIRPHRLGFWSVEEGVELYHHAPLTELMLVADGLRKQQVPHGRVTSGKSTAMSTPPMCIANCKFCNFFRIPGHPEAYITDMPTYRQKITRKPSILLQCPLNYR
ncbi:MAG: hypothetical protein NVV59_02865 [Chitinophagaceae bacterium]|nr:hypothetical protein [Chitinophagaceae bacterium]